MSSVITAFIGSLEASASVLLTVLYGVIAGYFGLVSSRSATDFSRMAVRLFMPCLLFINVGSGFSLDTIGTYTPILVWSFGYNIISIIIGSIATRIFRLDGWVTAAVTFNNATSLPLLLLQSFAASGALSPISDGDASGAISRAKIYFLINATISNTLTFSLGPRLLRPTWKETEEGDDSESSAIENDAEPMDGDEDTRDDMPLLKRGEQRITSWAEATTDFAYQFWNAPFIGACIGAFVGLIPALHHHFFDKDGAFLAWLTVSLSNVGDLFASTQVILVGVKLYHTFMKMRQGQDSGHLPLLPTVSVLLIRFILWPVISISIIYLFAAKTQLLANDPILWFCLMMMPVGPSAMRLSALADVSKVDEQEKMAVAKFLALSYMVTPIICFAAVGSLKASEMASIRET